MNEMMSIVVGIVMNNRFLVRYFLFWVLSLNFVNFSYADTDSSTQTLGITIPLVALMDVESLSPSFSFTAPTDAGFGFEDLEPPVDNEPSLAISSNNTDAKLTAVLSSALDSISVQVKAKNCGTGSNSTKTLSTTTAKQLCAPGMLVTDTASLEVNINPTLNGGMIPYGVYSTSIIYTLTEN